MTTGPGLWRLTYRDPRKQSVRISPAGLEPSSAAGRLHGQVGRGTIFRRRGDRAKDLRCERGGRRSGTPAGRGTPTRKSTPDDDGAPPGKRIPAAQETPEAQEIPEARTAAPARPKPPPGPDRPRRRRRRPHRRTGPRRRRPAP